MTLLDAATMLAAVGLAATLIAALVADVSEPEEVKIKRWAITGKIMVLTLVAVLAVVILKASA